MILPLAASVALATAPTASAATPTTAAFTHSSVSAGGHYGHRGGGYYDREFYWNRNGYYPFAGPTFGGYGPVYSQLRLCKEYTGEYNYPYFIVPC